MKFCENNLLQGLKNTIIIMLMLKFFIKYSLVFSNIRFSDIGLKVKDFIVKLKLLIASNSYKNSHNIEVAETINLLINGYIY